MTTVYALLLDRCGLSLSEAAAFRAASTGRTCSIETVRSWSSGRSVARQSAVAELRALYQRIEHAAEAAIALIAQQPDADVVELGIARDDDEARSLGLPCVGAQAAMLGLVAARCDRPVRVVPRAIIAALRSVVVPESMTASGVSPASGTPLEP